MYMLLTAQVKFVWVAHRAKNSLFYTSCQSVAGNETRDRRSCLASCMYIPGHSTNRADHRTVEELPHCM